MSRIFKIVIAIVCVEVCLQITSIVHGSRYDDASKTGPVYRYNRTLYAAAIPKASVRHFKQSITNLKCANSHEIACKDNSKCIRSNQMCDRIVDCLDKSDEENCECA